MKYQSLPKFLTLTVAETNSLAPLLELSNRLDATSELSSKNMTKLMSKIGKINMDLLIKSALIYPKLDSLCKHPCLKRIWNEKWRLWGLNPTNEDGCPTNPDVPIHEYKPQITMPTFDLLKGIFIYGLYQHHLKADEAHDRAHAPAYLNLAAYLGYFPALSALCKQGIAEGKFDQAFLYALKAGALYWTPGYLLLAITTYAAAKDNDTFLFQTALSHLIKAEKLRPHSEAMINNAYQGKSLDSIVAAAGLRDLTAAKVTLAQLAEIEMSWVTQTLYKQVSKEVSDILGSVSKLDVSYGQEIRETGVRSESQHEINEHDGESSPRLSF